MGEVVQRKNQKLSLLLPSANISALFSDDSTLLQSSLRERWPAWLLLLLLALFLHAIFFTSLAHIDWSLPKTPPRVEVTQVDPHKLDAIRKEWKRRDMQEKGLLLDRDKNAPKQEAPDNARYMSDRNIRVQKEQRARDTTVVPKPGSPSRAEKSNGQSASHPQEEIHKQPPVPHSQVLPKIGNLGVPMFAPHPNTAQKDQEKADGLSQDSKDRTPRSNEPGGNQYMDDKRVPEGSENMLNAEESVYYSFFARLYETIGPIWSSKLREIAYNVHVLPGDYTTAVDLVLDPEGNLIEVRVLQSSGIKEFDQIVDSSWRRIGKFPNPPKGLIKEDGYVHSGWNFTVQMGQQNGLSFLPPERSY
jgi:TonB family protein